VWPEREVATLVSSFNGSGLTVTSVVVPAAEARGLDPQAAARTLATNCWLVRPSWGIVAITVDAA
jgi:hypothetical protein